MVQYITFELTDYDVIYIDILNCGGLPNPFFSTSFRYDMIHDLLIPENNNCDITNNEIFKELKKMYGLSH